MADNYLERKMEEYRNGTLAQSLRRSVAMTRKRPKSRYEALRVLVICPDLNPDAEKLIRTFAARRCRISFASRSRAAGPAAAGRRPLKGRKSGGVRRCFLRGRGAEPAAGHL